MFDPERQQEPQGGAEGREHVSGPSEHGVDPSGLSGLPMPCAACGSIKYRQEIREVTIQCENKQHAADGGALQVRRCLRCQDCGGETRVTVIPKKCVLCEHEKHTKQAIRREI